MISPGSVSIHPEHVGPTSKPLRLWLLTSRRWTEPNPINVYGIEHREGLVLFPTPRHTPGSQSMLVRRPGRVPLLLV